MRKILCVAGGIAGDVLSAAVKLGKRLACIALGALCAMATATGRAVKNLLHRVACNVGKKMQDIIPPVCRIVMIVSAAVAALSCVGWLLSRKKLA